MALLLKNENLIPEAGQIRALYSQLEALLNVAEGAKKKKRPDFKGDKNTVSVPIAA